MKAADWEVVEERPMSEWDVVAQEPVRTGQVVTGRPARAEIPVDPTLMAPPAMRTYTSAAEDQRRARVAQENPIAEKVLGAVEGVLDIVAKIGGGSVGGLLGLASAPFRAGPADQNMAEGAQAGVDLVRKGYGLAGLPAAQGATTQTGAALSEGFDKAMEGLPPVAGVFGTLAAPVAARPRAISTRQAVQALPAAIGQTVVDAVPGPVADASRRALVEGRQAARTALDRGVAALPARLRPGTRGQPMQPAAGTMASGGAAGTDAALQRRERAAALPVPIELTEGQATRSFEQLRFERETAKNSAAGGPLRELDAEQNQRLLQNLDALEELTGSTTASSYDAGSKVVQALAEKAGRAKARIDEAYAKAREAGDTAEPVPYAGILEYIEDQTPTTRDKLAPIIRAVEEQLRRNDPEGSGVVSIDALETMRQTVRANTEPGTPGGFHGGQLIKLIDEATEGAQGDLYKAARKLRAEFGRQFQDRGVVADLLESKKGTDDRKVKIERVVDRAVVAAGVDDLRFLRGLLVNEGDAGRQAWREVQGRVIASFREHALGGAADIRGNPVVSPTKLAKRVEALDRDGKLEVLFDKKGAQLVRDLVEATQDMRTAPAGAVNLSSTSSAFKDLWDQLITFGVSGLPARGLAVFGAIRKDLADRKVRQQVRAALPPKSEAKPRADLAGIFDTKPDTEAAQPPARPALPAPAREGSSDARLQEIEALRAGASPETLRVLEAEAKRVRAELASRSKVAAQQTEVEALERAARAASNASVKRALQARADALRAEKIPTGEARELDTVPMPKAGRVGRIPVGEARELPPSTGRAPAAKPLPVGDVRELSREQARKVAPTRRERDLLELRDEATDSVVIKELDAAIAQERRKAADKARGQEYLRLADTAKDPDLREQFEAKAAELGVKRRALPVGEATELPATPGTVRAVQAVKLNARDQAAWNALFRFGGLDSETSGLMIAAARVDPMALDRALKQFEGKPALLQQELRRIVNREK